MTLKLPAISLFSDFFISTRKDIYRSYIGFIKQRYSINTNYYTEVPHILDRLLHPSLWQPVD